LGRRHPHVVHPLTVPGRRREHQIWPSGRRICRRSPRSPEEGKTSRAAGPPPLLGPMAATSVSSSPAGAKQGLAPSLRPLVPAVSSTSRSRQESHGRTAAPPRSLPLPFIRPLPGLRFEQWRLGGHPRRGSMARPHCLASCSRCGFPLPSSGLAGVACRGRGSQRPLRDACGDGCGCCVLSLLPHKVDLKVTMSVIAVDSLYNYELLT
jgi:hypothetical protein